MELQVGVKIILQNKEGKILILFRSFNTIPKPRKEYWDIPGGRINPGSSLMDNLKREVMEETELQIKGQPKLIYAQDILKDKHVVRLTYAGFADGEVKLSEEHSEYKWLSLEEIKSFDLMDSYFKEVLDKFDINL